MHALAKPAATPTNSARPSFSAWSSPSARSGLSLLIAVAITTLSAGCKTYNQVTPARTPVLLVDQGTVKTFRPVTIDYTPAFSSKHVTDTYLMPDNVRRFDTNNADWAVSFAPAWHKSVVYDTARWITLNQPADLTRWLVSANPTVVALGASPDSTRGVRPISAEDLDQHVSRLVILDPWQKPPLTDNTPPANIKVLDLPETPSLRELMARAPWLGK